MIQEVEVPIQGCSLPNYSTFKLKFPIILYENKSKLPAQIQYHRIRRMQRHMSLRSYSQFNSNNLIVSLTISYNY